MNMNSTTAITLNDRFSMIKKPSLTRVNSGRSRSRSREPRQKQQRSRSATLRGSHRNQALLNQLERQHKMRMALKLKNKSIMTTRGRVQGQLARTKLKRATTIRNTMNARSLTRNNLTKFVPLNDTPGRMARGRSRSRSRSRNRIQQNNVPIQERLGFPAGRRRMRRGGQIQQQQQTNGAAQRSRSRSRVRLNRNNFRNGNQVQAQMKRSNSVNSRLGGNGPNMIQRRQQQQQQQIRRRRTRSQSRGNAGGNKRPANQLRMNRPLQGRIIKRKPQRTPGLNTVRRNVNVGNAIRNAKKFKRGQPAIARKFNGGQQQQGNARGRARNRGPQNKNNQQGQQQQRRGRSRTRRGGGNSNNRGGGKPQVSKEMLDKQLDDYMSKA